MWYRNLYLPKPADRLNWHASPIFAPEENFAKLPPTFVTVAGCGKLVPYNGDLLSICQIIDVLRDEGVVYAKKCKDAGVHVRLKGKQSMHSRRFEVDECPIVYEGMPHPAISQDALLTKGAEWMTDLCDALKEAFWP